MEIAAPNIVGAALLTQLMLVVVYAIALAMLARPFASRGRFREGESFQTSFGAWVLIFLLLATFAPLLFSDAFAQLWGPVFGSKTPGGLAWTSALTLVFLCNLGVSGLLIYLTGGSAASPFQSMLFLFPPLAIFLRQPVRQVIIYGVIAGFIEAWLLFYETAVFQDRRMVRNKIATTFVAISCLAIALLAGIITRPV
jgi:hypothetical protein